MTEQVQWLVKQFDEDERIARRVESSWRQIGETGVIVASDGNRAEECANGNWTGIAEHIVEHDPERVLREVAAKRQLVQAHAKDDHFDGCTICDSGNNSCGCMCGSHWTYPCDTIKILALPYADRPGYQEAWRP
ncbi:DUF6221 family protein [Streptomyces sp. NPDC101455]|uniref:DUF6221 family protein n=1 Tax=Streptomyces sp. NPDC101455 TaxID=3366142 RepID=UPI0037F42A7D